MECAYIFKNNRQKELIYITELEYESESERSDTCSNQYQCPSEKCGVPVFPALPKKKKTGRIKAPRAYFRAGSSNPHEEACTRDNGLRKEESSNRSTKKRKLSNSSADLADFPMRFDDSPYRENRHHDGESNAYELENVFEQETNKNSSAKPTKESKKSSRHIREFVKYYEKFPEKRISKKIVIPGCRARNFEEAFRPVKTAVDDQGISYGLYIYYGTYKNYKDYRSGVSIIFSDSALDGNELTVWVRDKLESKNSQKELRLRLRQSGAKNSAVIYVLGEFQQRPKKSGDSTEIKYSVELNGLNYLWVAFPSDEY